MTSTALGLVREASQPREATSHRRAQRTSGHLRQADPYSLADETWRDPPRRSSTSSRSRSPDRRPGPAEHYRLDAYSSEEEPPQDAESIRTGRSVYVPRRVYEAPTHTEPIALHSRRIGAIQPPPPKAAPKVIFGSKPPLPKEPRAASSAPAKADIPRKSPPRARSPIRTQSAFGYKAPPRGLNKAEPRSKSGSNPPQGYIVKPPPPQVVKAAAASAATSEAGARFRSPPRRPPPAPPPPPGRPVPPKELTIALDWHGVLDVGQHNPASRSICSRLRTYKFYSAILRGQGCKRVSPPRVPGRPGARADDIWTHFLCDKNHTRKVG